MIARGRKRVIYGYIRVSTSTQTIENQKFEISQYLKARDMHEPIKWIEDVKSGAIEYKERSLGRLITRMTKNDTLIVSEISRLGRKMLMVMEILNVLLSKGINFISIKENLVFDNSITSKVITFAFSLSAEIERNLISQRTKEALDLRRHSGVRLGRPAGAKNKHYKLDIYEDKIKSGIDKGYTLYRIAKMCKCNLATLINYIKRKEMLSNKG